MIVVTLPLKLVSEANAHEHWRVRQKRAKAQRGAASIALVCPLVRAKRAMAFGDPWPCVVTITRIAPRALDSDNVVGSAKHVRDGVADALGIDDRDPRVTWRVEQRRGLPKQYACEIKLEWSDAHARDPDIANYADHVSSLKCTGAAHGTDSLATIGSDGHQTAAAAEGLDQAGADVPDHAKRRRRRRVGGVNAA